MGSIHPSISAAERVGGAWAEAGDSSEALARISSDSEQPFSLNRQEINQPDCGLGSGGAPSLQVPGLLVYKVSSRRGPCLVLSD